MRTIILAFVLLAIFSLPATAQERLPRDHYPSGFHEAPRYRESEAHPLRVFAYLLHPVGWVAREFVFRPMSYIASSTPKRANVFGYRAPHDYRKTICYNGENAFPSCNQNEEFSKHYGGSK